MKPCIFATLLFLAACNKDNDNNTNQTNTEIISAKPWVYESGGVDQDKNGSVDVTFEASGFVQTCLLDNVISFKADGSGVADEGATKCSTASPQTSNFNWNFLNNESVLNITGTTVFGGGQFNIKTLNDAHLTLAKDTIITYLGVPLNVSVVANLKRQ